MLISVYGASGYQAKLVLAELSRRGTPAVLVGRDAGRLRRAADAVGLTGAEQRIAPLDDHAALVEAFTGCDAVINCAGPFTGSGQAVVAAAIEAGCHYVDTAGEQLYVKEIFDRFATDAERAGVSVLPAANDGCLPVDLLAHLLAEQAGPIAEITTGHLIVGGGGPSRGSLRSALATADAFVSGGLTYSGGDWAPGIPARSHSITFPGQAEPTEMTKMPLVEVITIPRHVCARHVESLGEARLGARLGTIAPEVIETLAEGPAEKDRVAQRFTYVVDAVRHDREAVRGVVRGTDTYGTTAVIAVEAAQRLASSAEPGVLAPAQAVDPADFLEFLAGQELSWAIGDPQ
ncbi:saccharopine dehydrogenase family protein [Amycolatopsis taiwanensis]|uniref:saccharopine dehydrogenase family protein n=1 Tax=Amycolatopsis taiwanensis TaxID=342230 RepID=UPI000489DC8D|nr:saccharopine dehydrogenase NADP-binding domain-containing protein [Amycolatopsis taiwanensis]